MSMKCFWEHLLIGEAYKLNQNNKELYPKFMADDDFFWKYNFFEQAMNRIWENRIKLDKVDKILNVYFSISLSKLEV